MSSSHIRLSVVCNVRAFVHPTQLVKFSAMFIRHFVPYPSADLHAQFYGDVPGNPSIGVKCNRFSQHFDLSKAISEMVQYTASGTVND